MTVNATKAFLIDLLERAGKTFVQAAVATLSVEWAASGFDVAHLPTVAAVEKIVFAAVLAGGAAVVSMVTSVVSGLKTGTASASTAVANSTPTSTGTHAVTLDPVAVTASAAPAVSFPTTGATA